MVKQDPSMGTMSTAPLLLSSLLDRGAQLQPDNLIIEKTEEGYHTLTFAEHLRRTRCLADALTKLGVRRGDRVGSFCWNTNRHLQIYHAIPCMGAALVPMNIRLGGAELTYIIKDAGNRLCIVDDNLLSQFTAIGDLTSVDLGVIVCGAVSPDSLPSVPSNWRQSADAQKLTSMLHRNAPLQDYDEVIGMSQPFFDWPQDIDENAATTVCYTSGTTGNPKGVACSQRSQFLHTLMMPTKDNHDVGGADVLLPLVPYFHANGWGIPHLVLMLGARVLHNNRFTDPASCLQMAIDHGATYTAAVPAVWQTIKTTLQDDPARYKGSLKLTQIACGGSGPSPDLMKWYGDEFGISFVQGYGMTETSPLATFARPVSFYSHSLLDQEEQFKNVMCAGIPVPGVQVKIVDPDDFSKELPHDGEAQGELLLRGPWITAGYYQRDDKEATSKFHNGWLATGDVVSIKNGALIIRDRSKDLIKSGGEWISSKDVENHILALPSIDQCAVVAQPHPKWDERPVVVAVLTKGADPDSHGILKEVQKHCAASFAKYEVPDDVILWPELPMTGTGKVSKKDIRQKLQKDGYKLPDLRTQSKL